MAGTTNVISTKMISSVLKGFLLKCYAQRSPLALMTR